MLIAISSAFVIVLSLAAMFLSRPTLQTSNSSPDTSFWHDLESNISNIWLADDPNRWRTFRETQLLLRQEGGEEGHSVDCCPSVMEMVQPKGGRNEEDMFVELYQGGDTKQSFYELSCRPGIENKPCRFMDRKLHNQSRCIQTYSYSYALVRAPKTQLDMENEASLQTGMENSTRKRRHHHGEEDLHGSQPSSIPSLPTGGNWMLGYIRVRSGCSCQILPKAKNKRTLAKKKAKLKSK